jgi:hypothetical protein
MRPKIVALVIGIAFVAIIALSLLRGRQNRPNDSSADAASEAVRKSAAGRTAGASDQERATNAFSSAVAPPRDVPAGIQPASLVNSRSAPTAKSSSSGQSQSREDYIEQRVGELMDLAMTDDPESLKTILSEVSNPEGEIRKAAIEATKQFGSTNAIPKLEDALASADPADKQDLREAIDFLKLPSFLAKRN